MRLRIARFGFAIAVLAIVGIALLLGSDRVGLRALGVMLLGVAAVIAVALVFLEVGLSEDRERRREQRSPRSPET
jgi:hypothetical protein